MNVAATADSGKEMAGRKEETPQAIRVLIVEDKEWDASLLVRVLKQGGFDVRWTRVDGSYQMRAALASALWDLIISDYNMPGFSGLEALEIYQESGLGIPFIVVSGEVSEETVVECMRRGAHDCLIKDRLARLPEAVRRELRETEVRRERHEAEAALAENEKRLRLIWENVEAGVMLVDATTREILDVNPKAARLVGCPQEQMTGHVCHRFVCPAERENCPVLDLGQTVDRSERKLIRADGTEIAVMKSVTPCEMNGRRVLLENFVDIRELRAAEDRQALHAEVLAVLNRPNQWSHLLDDLLGVIRDYTHFDAVGIRLKDGEDYPYYEQSGFSDSFVKSEGSLCVRDEDGGIVRAPDGQPCLVCMCGCVIGAHTDPSLPCFTENGSFWSNSLSQLVENDLAVLPPEIHLRNGCLSAGYESVALIPLQAGNGIVGLLQLNDRKPGRLAHETIRFFEGIAASIGVAVTRKQMEENRIQLESQLRQSQKLESLGTLAGGVAHEINNPINGIMNYAQLILDRLGPDHPVAEFAEEIGHETDRVATIVRNLLSFARRDNSGSSKARVVDVVDRTLSLVTTVLRHDQVTLKVNVPDDLPEIDCRSQQMQQVLMNLITNARDALTGQCDGGDAAKTITISAELGQRHADGTWGADSATAPSRVATQYVRITVEDSGPGMSAEVREHLFDPFYTTKSRDKGTGLGLSISHGIVRDHGGVLSVESEPGHGARFHVDLPTRQKPLPGKTDTTGDQESGTPNGPQSSAGQQE